MLTEPVHGDQLSEPAVHTPSSEAGETLGTLSEVFVSWFPERPADEFQKKWLAEMWADDELFAAPTHNTLGKSEFRESDELNDDPTPLMLFVLACATCIKAIKCEQLGRREEAWFLACVGAKIVGTIQGIDANRAGAKGALSDLAKRAAGVRHSENREMKAQVLEWFAENRGKYRSKDEAAAIIAGKVVPVTFRTVREWLKGQAPN